MDKLNCTDQLRCAKTNAISTAQGASNATGLRTSLHGLKCTASRWAMLAVFATASSVFVAPQRAEAHGAWIGNCRVDFSATTLTEIQARVNAGDDGIGNDDFIEYIANCPVIIAGTQSGPGGYVTFYKPTGTEIAGAWIIDAAGTAINARPATSAVTGEGISRGWGPIGQKTFVTTAGTGWNPSSTTDCVAANFTTANCNAGVAYVYGDTGIFYSTRDDTKMFTGGAAAVSVLNGYQTNPTNGTPWGTVGGTGNERVHNKWDAVQTNAFGSATVITNGFTAAEEVVLANGRGSTPFNAGSPVAGPDSGMKWDRYGTNGPWNRISYPGSCFANDPTIAGTEGPANGAGSVVPQAAGAAINSVNVCTTTTAGASPSDAALLPNETNALRFAVGGIHNGETHRIRVRVKVTNAANLGLPNFEGHGGDSTQGVAAGNDNPWRYWVGAPSAATVGTARLYINKAIVSVNGAAYNGTSIAPGATIRYRVSYTNAFTAPQTNVVVSDILPTQATGTSNFTVISGPNIVPTALPTSGTFNFLTIASLSPGSGAVEFDVSTSAAAGATVTNVARINSTQVSTLQTDSVATLVVAPAVMVAANDSVGGLTNGVGGLPNVLNAFTGDTVNGAAATSANATLALAPGASLPAGFTFDTTTGDVSVAAGVTAGAYSFNYQICEAGNATNCKIATINVTIVTPAAVVVATNDAVSNVYGVAGAANVLNVLTGDTVNGAAATTTNTVLSVASGSSVPAELVFDPATGNISVVSGTPAGTYSFDYMICETVNPSNCKTATATITTTATIVVVANNGAATNVNGVSGGGNVVNGFTGNTIAGVAASPANATLSVASGSTVPAGLAFDPATGNVDVLPGILAGTYSFDYSICAIADPSICATATITVTVNPSVDLMISKSNGVSSVAPGSSSTYTVVITNNGPDSVTGAVASDVPGAGITCPATNAVTIAGSGVPSGSFTIADLTGPGITLGTLLDGQSATLTYSCQVN